MDKCFIDALFANTDKKVKGEEYKKRQHRDGMLPEEDYLFE